MRPAPCPHRTWHEGGVDAPAGRFCDQCGEKISTNRGSTADRAVQQRALDLRQSQQFEKTRLELHNRTRRT